MDEAVDAGRIAAQVDARGARPANARRPAPPEPRGIEAEGSGRRSPVGSVPVRRTAFEAIAGRAPDLPAFDRISGGGGPS